MKPSVFRRTARDCLCACRLVTSTLAMFVWVRGVFGCVRDTGSPFVLIADGRFDFLWPSLPSAAPDFALLAGPVAPVTVLLRPSLCSCRGVSGATSSIGRGLRACATASGATCCDSRGTPTLARTKLDSTVTGRTFSCIRSLLTGSAPPNTILCTLLYILRHVWKAFEAGCEERSWR